MYGDTRAIRRLAAAVREQAREIDREAADLLAMAEACPWSGWAAAAMRRRSRDRSAALRRTADRHRGAADALDHHADEVDRLKDLIAAIERRVAGLVDAARDRIADLGRDLLTGLRRALPEPADELLDGFVPPPPGHRDWLAVELPGLTP